MQKYVNFEGRPEIDYCINIPRKRWITIELDAKLLCLYTPSGVIIYIKALFYKYEPKPIHAYYGYKLLLEDEPSISL